jgi:hypothetical protein
MTPDGTVLHQRVFQKNLLTRLDVPAGENRLAAGADNLFRNRRRMPVGLHGDKNQNRHSDEKYQRNAAAPPG